MFERVSAPGEDRPKALSGLVQELAAHVASERSAVEPVLRKNETGDEDLAAGLVDDYDRIEKLLVLIERRKVNSPDVPDLVSELKAAVEEHMARSDRVLFPTLARTLTPEEQLDLGERIEQADDMILTHPHPHLLSLGPIANKLTALASRWDRLRDRTVTNTPPAERGLGRSGGT